MPGIASSRRGRRVLRLPDVNLHPAQVIVAGFGAVTLIGTVLLMLPISSQASGGTPFVEALFHATSAVCVTGLNSLDTAEHWSTFGKVVLLVLVQAGGLGIMSFASILGLIVAGRMGLRTRMQAAAETGTLDVGDLRRLLLNVAKVSIGIELVVAVALALRWWIGYDESFGHALWLGVFHGISSFNNAGFALWSDSLGPFVSDPWICLPIAFAVILGSVGFPVLMELRREFRSSLHWTMNTRIVVVFSLVMLVGGTLFVTLSEWSNPRTLGTLDTPTKLLAGFFQAVMPRSGGFTTVDVGQMDPLTWFGIDVMMFIGGGPAGTAGGIKLTTFAVLLFLVVTEIRGDGAVNIFGRRLPRSVQRQATTVAVFATTLVVFSTALLMTIEGIDLDHALFEIISAFATVGLSTGVTLQLSDPGQLVITVLMFIGRLGPITFASAIALKRTSRLYEYPKERPIIG